MRIFTEQAIKRFTEEHPDSLTAFQVWVSVVKASRWTCYADIKKDFNSVDAVGNQWAVARVEQLLPLVDDNTPRTDPNSIELELLSNLVADYSEENFSIGKPTLGDVIRLRMSELGITQTKLAEILGISASRISEFIAGKAEPTLKIARDLVIKLDIAPAVVLGL